MRTKNCRPGRRSVRADNRRALSRRALVPTGVRPVSLELAVGLTGGAQSAQPRASVRRER